MAVTIDTIVSLAAAAVCLGILVVTGRTLWRSPRGSWRLGLARVVGLLEGALSVVWYTGIAISHSPKLDALDAIGWVIYVTPGVFALGLMAVLLQTADTGGSST